MSSGVKKTNAMRMLDGAKIPYEVRTYEFEETDLAGVHAADAVGMPYETVFKTLVARGDKTGFVVFCIPVAEELDLKKAARASKNKSVELLHVKDLLPTTGYIRGGCSPVGMKKEFPTYIDETAMLFDAIAVSGGTVMDLVINEEEAVWVRELFYKVVHEGASGYALAEILNNRGLRTRAGAKFQSSNILRIIRHEGYTGYIITKNARSEYIPELQIIDQDTFEKANDIISRRSAKTAQDRRIAHTSQNPTLLAGIVYCAHCGAKMSGFMHTDRYKLADGSIREKVQPKYNCFQRGQRNKGGRDCDGQALYLAERVDAIVLKIVEEVFEKIRDTPYSQVAENRIRQESNLQKTKRAAVEKKIKAAQHALERFEGEILKCLDGTSNFTEDMIAKQIRRYQQELDDAKAEYAELRNASLNEAAEIRKLRTYYDDFRGWAEEFDAAPLEMKRMILSHLIDRVEVGRKYQVTIKLNMEYQQFLDCSLDTDCSAEIGA